MNELIDKAIKFACCAHHDQFRKGSNIPYISHPFAVALILQKAEASDEQIIAGILHDVVEDTHASLQDIKFEFGSKIAELVEACSECDPKAPWEERKQNTLDSLKTASDEVKLIVCADKLHNLLSIKEDLKVIGDEVWKKFGRGKESQTWYYLKLVETLCADLKTKPKSSIFHKFKEEVYSLFQAS